MHLLSSLSFRLLSGLIFHSAVLFNVHVSAQVYCPPLKAPEGVQLQCVTREGLGKVTNKASHSLVTDDCSSLTSPMTLAKFRCKPHYTSTLLDSTEGVIKCNRKGKWRHAKRLRAFSCHLHTAGWIDKLIEENTVMIFGKSYCGYCKQIKSLFSSLNVKYHVVEVDHLSEKRASLVKEALYDKTGMKTWPNVFVNGRHLGGYDDTIYAHRDGSLQFLLIA